MTELARSTTQLVPQGNLGSLDALAYRAWLLCDVSSSMNTPLRSVTEPTRRIDRLRTIVAEVRSKGHDFQLATFSDGVTETSTIPEPYGGTALHLALDYARENGASKICVVSDGEPNSKPLAIASADLCRVAGIIVDVAYVGDPGAPGEATLAEIAGLTGGRSQTVDLNLEPAALTGGVIKMLTDGSEASKTIAL